MTGNLNNLLINKMIIGAFLVAQKVKNSPAMRETWIQSLSWEDPLEEGMTTRSSLENPHGQRSLEGYSPWGCKESEMTEQVTFSLSLLLVHQTPTVCWVLCSLTTLIS